MVGYSRLAMQVARREGLALNVSVTVSVRTVLTVTQWADHVSALMDTMAQSETQFYAQCKHDGDLTVSMTDVIKYVRTERMGFTAVGRVDVRMMALVLTLMGRALAWMGGVVTFVNFRATVASTVIAAVENVCVYMEPLVIMSMDRVIVLMDGWEKIVLNRVRSV